VAVLVGGVGLLMSRLLVVGSRSAPLELAAIYVALLAVSLAVPVAFGSTAILSRTPVLLMGLGAVVASTFAVGLPIAAKATVTALVLNGIAAISEEAFFRRFLYGRLASLGPIVAIGGSAILFALIHLPVYGVPAFWIDLAAGLVLSWQRWASGSWAVPAATHFAANLLVVLR
jgi:membrane protease YdiL (CAAX protease family)